MPGLKTFFGLIAGSAAIGIVYILEVSAKNKARKKTINNRPVYNEDLKDNFTGWLKRLQQDIDKEINHHQPII